MIKELDYKTRFYGFVRQDRGAAPDPHPECAFHMLEVSNETSEINFITFGVKKRMSDRAEKLLADILPEPGYHDPGYFHIEGPVSEWAGCKHHYHIIYDAVPTPADIIVAVRRLEDLGGTFHPDVKEEILTHYGVNK